MKHDLLDEAVRALRDESADDGGGGEKFTRARVMASLHQGRVKRRTRIALLLPIAATFVAASAFGVGTEGGRAIVRRVQETLGFQAPAPAPAPAEAPAAKKPAARAAHKSAVAAAAPPPVAPAEQPEALPPVVPAPVVTPSASTSSARIEAELELYRTAHRAHFTDQDPGRALAAWDSYLARYSRGQFALEARYNRALCLVRLGRTAQARGALEPFARGDYQGYRQREATDLIGALPH